MMLRTKYTWFGQSAIVPSCSWRGIKIAMYLVNDAAASCEVIPAHGKELVVGVMKIANKEKCEG